MEHDIEWWKSEIKKDPRDVLNYDGSDEEELFLYALECGYKINKSDLKKRSPLFRRGNDDIARIIVEKKPSQVSFD